jgi:hypothetical protein
MMVKENRGGFALPAAIGGLVIVGVLVTGGFYMARQEVRIGVASKHAALAVNMAQTGANDIMANWNGYKLGLIPVWGDTTITDTLPSGIWSVTVANLNNNIYFLNAEGEITEGGALWSGATRNIGVVTRYIRANIDPPAALTTRGNTTLKGGAEVHGEDVIPPSWAGYCDPTLTDKTGVLTNDTTNLSTTGIGQVTGGPPYQQDSTIVDSTFTTFGDLEWDELVSLAKAEGKDVTGMGTSVSTVLPDSIGTVCRTSTLNNWGDPRDPGAACGSYFPLIYHGGPKLTIQSGGYGQGILLVDGTLDLRGDFVFNGLVVVQGNFETQGQGNRIYGAVMASNADFDAQSLVGGSVVSYSTCAVERAILNNSSLSRVRPLEIRSWMDLSGVVSW